MLTTLLREAWGGDLHVVADCDADIDVQQSHHYCASGGECGAAILLAGQDLDCGYGTLQGFVSQALSEGLVTQSDVNVSLTRLFRVFLKTGWFDALGASAVQGIGLEQVCSPAALELMRDSAVQGIVLVKNNNSALPLGAAAPSLRSALVVGPNFRTDLWSYYGGPACNAASPFENAKNTLLSELAALLPAANVSGLSGVPDVLSNDTSGVTQAAAAAAAADLVVLALGSNLLNEGEGLDRSTIALSDGQIALAAAVAAAARGTVVAVVFGGGAIDLSPLLQDANVGAVLWAGVPSVNVGGVADIILGLVAPAARLAQTVYPASFASEVSTLDFGLRPGPSPFPPFSNPGRTHRFFTGAPVLPFGFGISFSTWRYTPVPGPTPPSFAAIAAAAKAHHAGPNSVGTIPASLKAVAADFFVNVTNTGAVDSDDVVLGFLVPPGAGVDGVPLQELFGFERVFVRAGETVTVYLGAQGLRFCQAGADGVRRFLAGDYLARFGVRETLAHGGGFAELPLRVGG